MTMKIEKNKPRSIHLRLNDEQFDFMQTMAYSSGLTVSDLIRSMVNTVMVANAEIVDAIALKQANLSAKLGEPHADNENHIEHQL